MSDWVAPDTAADVPTRPRDREPAGAARGPRGQAAPPIGPRTPTELIDAGFSFLRRHPRQVVSTTALFVVPVSIVSAFLQRDLFDGESVLDVVASDPSTFTTDSTTTDGSSVLLSIVAFLGPSIGLVLVAGALAQMVVAERRGGVVDAAAGLRAAGRRVPALLVSWLLVHVIEVVGFALLVVPGVFAVIAFVAVAPAIVVEGIGPVAAMRRSNTLTSRRRGPVLGFVLMTAVVTFVLENALSLVPTTLAAIVGFDVGWLILGVGTAAISLLTTSFVALSTIELYLDLRVRTEALDVELRIIDLFDQRQPR